MKGLNSIFRTFDIRGSYPEMINEEISAKIGYCLSRMIAKEKVVVGCDKRLESQKLVEPLVFGLEKGGKEVVFLGEIPTEILYFAVGFFRFDLGIQITASHCPWGETGFKICRSNALSFGTSDLAKLKNNIDKIDFSYSGEKPYIIKTQNIYSDYAKHISEIIDPKKVEGKILIFSFGALAVKMIEQILRHSNLKVEIIALSEDELKTLPPNPLLKENQDLIKKQSRGNFDLIVALDGDSDRAIFFDPKNKAIVLPDFIAGLLSTAILEKKLGPVVFDCRKKMVLSAVAEKFGVPFFQTKAGYPFIKQEMHKRKAVFGGEVSGHYFYPENFYSESSMLTILLIIDFLNRHKMDLKEALKDFRQEVFSLPEENFPISNFNNIRQKLLSLFPQAKAEFIDGLTLYTEEWYLNIRPSQNEPLIRFNLEANSKDLVQDVYKKVKKTLQPKNWSY